MKFMKRSVQQLKNMCHKKQCIIYGFNEWSKLVLIKTGIISEVAYIIDENPHVWGTSQQIGESTFRIDSPELLTGINAFDYHIIIISMYQELLYEKLQKIIGKDKNIIIYYCPSDDDVKLTRFRPFLMKLKLQNRIVFRSGPENGGGNWDYADNARAMFEYMIQNRYNEKYELIWAVEDVSKYQHLEKEKNVKVISYRDAGSGILIKAFIYQYYLYTAKYFLFTDTCIWLRFHRKDRHWLIFGMDGIQKQSKTEPTGPHYDYMTVTSQLYDIHAEIFGQKGTDADHRITKRIGCSIRLMGS